MNFLATIEPFLFWGGLIVFCVSLAMYVGRTKDMKSVLMFWQPTISFNAIEFKVNRAGLGLMILAVVMRFIVFFVA
ncbi:MULTISPECIES: hypothetical protein [Neptunomonas]|uniref:Uncharacterized protein n=1 Tax=Neptunomonas marina TaxID=1815562 RepID=A0A437QB86_9GAMM|nr:MULTISPECIES: hypothetical protein [Neptunomonas]RVU31791.1 hypothetical protein EOE65_07375 [Neptunomonas marina]